MLTTIINLLSSLIKSNQTIKPNYQPTRVIYKASNSKDVTVDAINPCNLVCNSCNSKVSKLHTINAPKSAIDSTNKVLCDHCFASTMIALIPNHKIADYYQTRYAFNMPLKNPLKRA